MNDNFVGALADLTALNSTLTQRYVGPAVITIVICVSIMYLIKKELRPFVVFAAIAALAAIIIYAAPAIFGQGSTAVHNGATLITQVN
ncbi:hypothetical protein [Bifidobacterium aquikefiricola]|uniref:Uncharacterized protein n=1 Tax=Bifidobacterium aquikefiricola TaxID=3059038 RepID=A0AB39U7R2_9BIFI